MKKVFSLLVLIVLVFALSGCGSKLNDIKAEDIFNQEGKYYVYFYKDGCSDCEDASAVVEEYMEQLKEDKNKDKRKIYAVNLSDSENSLIYRQYKGENGQGDEGNFFVNEVTEWNKLYIGETSALIVVGTNTEKEKFVTFKASGSDDITTVLGEELSDD